MKKYVCDILNMYKEQNKLYLEFYDKYEIAFSEEAFDYMWNARETTRGYLEYIFGECFYEDKEVEMFLAGNRSVTCIYKYLTKRNENK